MRTSKPTDQSPPAAIDLVGWLEFHNYQAKHLAAKLGVTPNTVSRWVRGAVTPSLREAFSVEDYTGIPARDWLRSV